MPRIARAEDKSKSKQGWELIYKRRSTLKGKQSPKTLARTPGTPLPGYSLTHFSLLHRERVLQLEFLELGDSMDITGAVEKWHLAGHIPECFPKFSLNIVEGAGQVEGEILETLWSRMDEVAGLAQSMSIAHHQETVDENMNDNNWQKIIRIGRNLYSMCYLVELT